MDNNLRNHYGILRMSPTDSLQPEAANYLIQSTLQDRITGVIIGSALGDTIGLYTEFLSSAQAKSSYPSGRFTLHPTPTPFKLDRHRAPFTPGHWTDDTDHAVLLLLSFLHKSTSFNHVFPTQTDFAERLRIWASQGFKPLDTMPLGLGKLMGTVLMSKGFDTEPEKIAREHWESTKRMAAPNGSLMRTHTLGLMTLWEEETKCFELAADISRATHVDPRCVVACVVGSALVRAVVRGEIRAGQDIDDLVGRAKGWYESVGKREEDSNPEFDWKLLEIYCEAKDTLEGLGLDRVPFIGFVYNTLGAGVLLLKMAIKTDCGMLDRAKLFEELITELIMHGGDADTNACFAGALLGGYLGFASLPDNWKQGMVHGKWLVGKAESLCQVLNVKEGEYNGREDADTAPLGGKAAVSQQEMEGKWMVFQQETMRKMDEAKKMGEFKAGETVTNSKSTKAQAIKSAEPKTAESSLKSSWSRSVLWKRSKKQ